MEINCELCRLVNGRIITKKYYSNFLITVIDCKTCRVPMVVLNRHSLNPNNIELAKMITKAVEVGDEMFGKDKYIIDKNQRCIKDHLHWHIRRE